MSESREGAYVVTQEAVYMHGTFGPFASEEEARVAADAFALDQCEDGHHKYAVRRMSPTGGLSGPLYIARRPERRIHHGGPCYDIGVDRRDAVGRTGSSTPSSLGYDDLEDVPTGPQVNEP